MNDRPRRVYLPWSVDEDRRLLEARAEGVPLEALARRHGRSLGAIKSRLLHLNAPRPQPDAPSSSSAM